MITRWLTLWCVSVFNEHFMDWVWFPCPHGSCKLEGVSNKFPWHTENFELQTKQANSKSVGEAFEDIYYKCMEKNLCAPGRAKLLFLYEQHVTGPHVRVNFCVWLSASTEVLCGIIRNSHTGKIQKFSKKGRYYRYGRENFLYSSMSL